MSSAGQPNDWPAAWWLANATALQPIFPAATWYMICGDSRQHSTNYFLDKKSEVHGTDSGGWMSDNCNYPGRWFLVGGNQFLTASQNSLENLEVLLIQFGSHWKRWNVHMRVTIIDANETDTNVAAGHWLIVNDKATGWTINDCMN